MYSSKKSSRTQSMVNESDCGSESKDSIKKVHIKGTVRTSNSKIENQNTIDINFDLRSNSVDNQLEELYKNY